MKNFTKTNSNITPELRLTPWCPGSTDSCSALKPGFLQKIIELTKSKSSSSVKGTQINSLLGFNVNSKVLPTPKKL